MQLATLASRKRTGNTVINSWSVANANAASKAVASDRRWRASGHSGVSNRFTSANLAIGEADATRLPRACEAAVTHPRQRVVRTANGQVTDCRRECIWARYAHAVRGNG